MKFTLKHINEIRERTHAAYLALPVSFRLKGADGNMNDHEKVVFATFEAVVLTLRAINPDLINVELYNKLIKNSQLEFEDYDSVFGGI